jgi:hypothetical protein
MNRSQGSASPPIDAASTVNDVLRRYPLTDAVFLQHGPCFVGQRGASYLQYPEQTIGEYAARNGVDLEALLRLLNAAAETGRFEPRGSRRPSRRGHPPEGPIGYTVGYVGFQDSGIETESFVASLLARGPY